MHSLGLAMEFGLIPACSRGPLAKTGQTRTNLRDLQRQVSEGGLLRVRDAHIFTVNLFSLIIIISKGCQQVNAQGSTFNDVAGNQTNIQIVNNPPRASVEESDEDISIPVRASSFLLLYGQPSNLYPRKIWTSILNSTSIRH